MTKRMQRCLWAETSDRYRAYHDEEWGVPLHEEDRLFEFLILEGAQAGPSWETILNKRTRYREVFDGFDAAQVARYGAQKVDALLADAGIIRNRAKINAAIENARAFLKVQAAHGTFAHYIWQPAGGQPRQNQWRTLAEVPAFTPVSKAMSKQLRQDGFRFVGPTICYAFMQAAGMVNDHLVSCFRHAPLSTAYSPLGNTA